ncbi:YciI family protein [Rhizobium sp. KVB221]|uniref:YciI family protein n=1 Tax=Rhizobium setariae TaxID=2801340 RepID=A0A936YRF1_9HYPH|nr:YciI family protein [Rhizobium setariae]MBL0374283.1 YciI family protein [Rhizobium setariae]
MLFAIHCLDHDGGVQKRLAHYEAHKAYLAAAAVKTVISGPLVAEDGETMIGSLFVVSADSIDDVIVFNHNDPFHRENVWKDIKINQFIMRIDNRANGG